MTLRPIGNGDVFVYVQKDLERVAGSYPRDVLRIFEQRRLCRAFALR